MEEVHTHTPLEIYWNLLESGRKEGKKVGLFDDIVRVRKQVYYENDDAKSDAKVKREAPWDEDTDTDVTPPRRRKRRNVGLLPRYDGVYWCSSRIWIGMDDGVCCIVEY